MHTPRILHKLSEQYPGKTIIALPENTPTEILCEVEPTSNHPAYSKVIAVIDHSAPHFHRHTTETYTVLKGTLRVVVDGRVHELAEGDELVIQPGSMHFATGSETWISCYSEPGWVAEDHVLVTDPVPADTRYIPLTQQEYCCVPTCIQMIMLRHGIPLLPAELIGHHLGLVVPPGALEYFYNARTGPEPLPGYGTQVWKAEYAPNTAFKKLGIPLKMSWSLIDSFKTIAKFREYLSRVAQEDLDILICYDWPSLFDSREKDRWGHLSVLDRVFLEQDKVRFIDPNATAAKWISVSIPELYEAMVVHGSEKSGGFWEVRRD